MDRREMGRATNTICNRTYTTQWTIGGGLRGSTGAPKNVETRDEERRLLPGHGRKLPDGEPGRKKRNTGNEDDVRSRSGEGNRPKREKDDGLVERRRTGCSQHMGEISKRSTWKERELYYVICGSDMAPFIWEESNEQETE